MSEQDNWTTISLYNKLYKDVPKGWEKFFESKNTKQYLNNISNKMTEEEQNNGGSIRPDLRDVFKIFHLLKPQDVRIIILGQDPYPDNNGNGIAFMLKNSSTTYLNLSIRNIYAMIKNSGEHIAHEDGNLLNWVNQGVFLINSAFTVRHQDPGSYSEIWKPFTMSLVKFISSYKDSIHAGNDVKIFIAFGQQAEEIIRKNVSNKHISQYYPHPASSKFNVNCSLFKEVNNTLAKIPTNNKMNKHAKILW